MTCDDARSVPTRSLTATASELVASVRHIKMCKECRQWLMRLEEKVMGADPQAMTRPLTVAGMEVLKARIINSLASDSEA